MVGIEGLGTGSVTDIDKAVVLGMFFGDIGVLDMQLLIGPNR